jgi:hypothetical protein
LGISDVQALLWAIWARTGRFAEPQSVDGTAPAIDRLAGFLGRSVPPRL